MKTRRMVAALAVALLSVTASYGRKISVRQCSKYRRCIVKIVNEK